MRNLSKISPQTEVIVVNIRIVLSVLIAFVIAISLFHYVIYLQSSGISTSTDQESENIDEMQKKFYAKIANSNEKRIFVLGSSYVMGLNATLINELISKHHPDYHMYNLAIMGDHIKKRASVTNDLVLARPNLVLYGISEDDFEVPALINTIQTKPNYVLFDPQDLFDKGIRSFEKALSIDFPESPKSITWQLLRIMSKTNIEPTKFSPYVNTPFLKITKADTIIVSDLELKNLVNYITPFGKISNPEENEYLAELKSMIKTLHDNNIKVIFFIVPRHSYYLEKESDSYKNAFESILSELKIDADNIHPRNDYSNLPILHDLTHVSINKDASIFSEDIAKIILIEIGN